MVFRLFSHYASLGADVKRALHKQADGLVKALPNAQDLMTEMVPTIPHGAEPFLLHLLHLLTEKGA